MGIWTWGYKNIDKYLLPQWARDENLYTGRYTHNGPVKSSRHKSGTSGKATGAFMSVLLRAATVYTGDVKQNGWGESTDYWVGEYSLDMKYGKEDSFKEKTIPCAVNKNTGNVLFGGDSTIHVRSILMALWGAFMRDSEFESAFKQFANLYHDWLNNPAFADERMKECAVILADSAYYMTSGSNPEIKVLPDSASPTLTDTMCLANPGISNPYNVYGQLKHWNTDENSSEYTSSAQAPAQKKKKPEELMGAYQFGHQLSKYEQEAVPVITKNEMPNDLTLNVCKVIQQTTKSVRKVRNVLLYGPTGTGKSTMAKHIAACLNLPYVFYNCSADTTIMDLLVQCLPADGGKKLNVSKVDGVPDIDMMIYDPESAWKEMTGRKKAGVTMEKCMALAYEKMTGTKRDISFSEYVSFIISNAVAKAEKETGQSFMYVESPIVKAARYGWVVEIQEPTTIVQAGVLPGLNSLLDADGKIFLPTGEVVKRHPDCVVIATTNLNYQGCRAINQSFLRRFQFKAIVENPKGAEELKRLKAMVGYKKSDFVTEQMMKQMLDVTHRIKSKCDDLDLTEGDIGICETADWVNSANILYSVATAADYTIIPSATQDDDAVSQLRQIVRQTFNN